MRDVVEHAYYIAKKDLKEYYMKPGTISWGILFPIVFATAFIFRRGEYSLWAAPGLLAMAVLFSSTSMVGMSIVFERRMGSFERLLLFPARYTSIALGKSLGGFFFGLIASLSTLLVIYALLGAMPISPLLFALSVVLADLQSSSFGVLMAFTIKDPSQTMTIFNVVRLPMIFLSGVIIPISQLPLPLQAVSYVLPLTYSTEIMRYAYTGCYSVIPPVIAAVAMMLQTIAFLAATSILIRKSIP